MEIKGASWPSRENEAGGFVLHRTTVLTVSQRVASRADRSPADEGRELSVRAGGRGRVGGPAGFARRGAAVAGTGRRTAVDRAAGAALRPLGGGDPAASARRSAAAGCSCLSRPKEVTIRGSSAADRGFRLGPYEVAQKIGEGGMGSVYVGRRTGAVGFRRLFAIKVVRQDTGQEQAAERSFVREVQIGSLLDHPNTQSVYDVGTYKNQPYLVLQFVDGINLEEASYGRPVPAEILVPILLDVLRGLNGAHDLMDEDRRWLGLVHADVSPPNVLVGVDGVARLTDFGSARFTALGESGRADPTNLGKPAFMSPEQLMSEPLDRRSDLFAVGIMMWNGAHGAGAVLGGQLRADPGQRPSEGGAASQHLRQSKLPRRDLSASARPIARRSIHERRRDGGDADQGGGGQRPDSPFHRGRRLRPAPDGERRTSSAESGSRPWSPWIRSWRGRRIAARADRAAQRRAPIR